MHQMYDIMYFMGVVFVIIFYIAIFYEVFTSYLWEGVEKFMFGSFLGMTALAMILLCIALWRQIHV